jgi:hypothetical protein
MEEAGEPAMILYLLTLIALGVPARGRDHQGGRETSRPRFALTRYALSVLGVLMIARILISAVPRDFAREKG